MNLFKPLEKLCTEKELWQRQLSAKLEIDTPMYSKLERGERRAKREQVIKMAKLFNADEKELLSLWLAGQIYELVKEEKEIAKKAIKIVEDNI